MTVVRTAPDPPVPGTWTVLSLLQWATAYLTGRGFDEARLHVELMLGHVLSLKRLSLYLQFDRPLTPAELTAFKALFKRRLDREPLQYILAETEFMGLTLGVGPGVLIPRPETELLVEAAAGFIRAIRKEQVDVLDVGTGSGCIALGLAHVTPQASVIAIDNSPAAIVIARRNLERYPDLRVVFEEKDVRTASWSDSSYDLVVSNPPYIPPGDMDGLEPEVRVHEPREALTDEVDGLSFYATLFALGAHVLREGGGILCEIGHGQEEAVRASALRHGMQVREVVPDLAGIPRVIVAVPSAEREKGNPGCVLSCRG
jgi:release factor glutamine methyltransferase